MLVKLQRRRCKVVCAGISAKARCMMWASQDTVHTIGMVSPQLLLTGTPKVSTSQVSKLGAVARALFCIAA